MCRELALIEENLQVGMKPDESLSPSLSSFRSHFAAIHYQDIGSHFPFSSYTQCCTQYRGNLRPRLRPFAEEDSGRISKMLVLRTWEAGGPTQPIVRQWCVLTSFSLPSWKIPAEVGQSQQLDFPCLRELESG
jgi:hypothetical protein